MKPTQKAYQDFLKSDFWKELTRKKKQSVGGRCERCGRKEHLQSHHQRYPEDWFDTKLEDLEVLCSVCHGTEHGLNPYENSTYKEVTRDRIFFMFEDVFNWVRKGRLLRASQKRFMRIAQKLFPEDGAVEFKVGLMYKFSLIDPNTHDQINMENEGDI
jgi:hypothetical protein